MLNINFAALLSFALVTTFSPGPNNISSASMGVLHGYHRTLKYLAGITVGFFGVLLLCGWISRTLFALLPAFEPVLRVVGAGYILWLAVETLRADYAFDAHEHRTAGFIKGLLLQLLNPKGIVYGLTLYATFLAPITDVPAYLALSAALLAALCFIAISTWALFGSAIRTYLRQPRIRRAVNVALALLLVYTAVELSGLLPALH